MEEYSKMELEEAHKAILSTLNKCEKTEPKIKEGTAQKTLITRRISAFKIALSLIEKSIDETVK